MNAIYDIRDMVCEELDKIAEQGELTAGSLEAIHKLTDTLKNTYKIEMLEESGESYNGGWEASGTYPDRSYRSDRNGRSYADGNSYARRSRGRYSRSDASEMMVKKLDEMISQASDEKVRRALEMAKGKIEKM